MATRYLGNKTAGGQTLFAPSINQKAVCKFTNSGAAFVATSLSGQWNNATITSNHLIGVIYADNAGAPGALLGRTSAVSPDASGNVTGAPLQANVTIAAGASYWIGWLGDATTYAYNGLGGGSYAGNANTYGSGPSDPFGTPSTSSYTMVVWADGVDAPVVTSVSPLDATAGSTVTITGSGFTGATGVTFGGVSAPSYSVVSDTQITATVPATGFGDVAVANAGGSTTLTAPTAGYVIYESSPTTPGSNPPDGLASPWLLGPKGKAWLQAFGGVKDGVVSLAKDAVQARFPVSAPSDALGPLGDSRGFIRGVTEPEANFRARLLAAFQLWQWAGTPYGLLAALYSAGYPNPVIQTQTGQQYSLNGYTGNPAADLIVSTVPGLHLGGSPSELWSDIAVLILQPWPAAWGSTAPADGSADQQTVARLVAQWKPAHCRCVQLKAIKGPAWGVNMTWGSFTWGSGTVTAWTPPVG